MKAILVIIDGLGDDKIEEFGNKTPYEYAGTPCMERLASQGKSGCFEVCPPQFTPESMVCILNLLQLDRRFFTGGRAYFELLSHGYAINDEQIVLRCNLAAADQNNSLVSFNGGSLNSNDIEQISKQIKSNSSTQFIHLSGYRNLIIMNKSDFKNLECKTFPPHEFVGENLSFLLSDIYSSSAVLTNFLQESNNVLSKFNDPKYRYYLHPWGISKKTELPSFEKLYHKKAAAVCAAEIARGIAIALDMYLPKLSGATSDIDTNLAEKAQITCKMLDKHDFVLVHINGADEASHRHNYKQKTEFIENIDKTYFSYLLENIGCKTKIMICADHSTSSLSGKHTLTPVPFIISEIHGKKNSISFNKDISAKDTFDYLLSQDGL